MSTPQSTPAGKVGDNAPAGTVLTGTERTRVGGEMPTTAPLPTMRDVPGYLGGPA